MRNFLKDLGLKFYRVRAIPVPPKKTLAEHVADQAAFLETKLKPVLAAAQAGEGHVFFVDAAHFVFGPFLCYLWSFTRIFVRAASGRQRFNVLGAWNAVTRHLIAVTNATVVNTETMSELLRKIAALGLTGAITLVLDNARYQHNAAVKALASQLGITLLFLPSYSPNLNLIERLWKFTKRRALYGRYHPKFANFQAAIQEILDGIPTTYAQQLETLMTLNFQQFEDVFTNGRVRYIFRQQAALALYAPSSARWQTVGSKVARAMVRVSAAHLGDWLNALRPARDKLTAPLATIYREHPETERKLAFDVLQDYASDQPNVLANLLMDSEEAHFAVLFEKLKAHQQAVVPLLEEEMVKLLPEATETEKDGLAKRQARAAVALIRMDKAEEVWSLLRHSADPRLRSFIVNWLSPLGADPKLIVDELDRIDPNAKPTSAKGQQKMDAILFHPETSMRRALILALGTYRTEVLSPSERRLLIGKLLDLYRNDPDSGIHGAAEWTLRQWKQQKKVKTVDIDLVELKDRGDRRWFVNSQGQTFAVIEGPVEFHMGSPPTELDRDIDETPRRVVIPRRIRHRRQGGDGRAVSTLRRDQSPVRARPERPGPQQPRWGRTDDRRLLVRSRRLLQLAQRAREFAGRPVVLPPQRGRGLRRGDVDPWQRSRAHGLPAAHRGGMGIHLPLGCGD